MRSGDILASSNEKQQAQKEEARILKIMGILKHPLKDYYTKLNDELQSIESPIKRPLKDDNKIRKETNYKGQLP